MRKVKNVLFRTNLSGKGIVNFDSNDQKWMYNGTNLASTMGTRFNNTSYAKKRFYGNKENLSYKLTISSDCLRHDIFKEDYLNQSPNVVNNESVLYSFIASPASIIRGYLFASKNETFKRKGALTITDAEQTCNATSYIETFSKSGEKMDKNDDNESADNSYYKKEVVGNIEYKAVGNIDLMGLQFIPCDKVFDRYSFNPDMIDAYTTFLKTKLPTFNSKIEYYQINGSSIEIPEKGLLLDNETTIILVRELFKRMLKLNIQRKSAFARITELEYKLVYDVIDDTFDSEDGWISLKTQSDIDSINFEVEQFYSLKDLEAAKLTRKIMEETYENYKAENKKAKTESAKLTAENKAKKSKKTDDNRKED